MTPSENSSLVFFPAPGDDVYGHTDRDRYPWFPLPDGKVVHFEVKCRRCGTGLCQGSNGAMGDMRMPVVMVPLCPVCFREIRG